MVPLQPSFPEFQALTERGNLIPVFTELAADYETPISVYRKLRGRGGSSFLLESAEKSDQIGRFSFLGNEPRSVITAWGREMEIRHGDERTAYTAEADSEPLREVENEMARFQPVPVEGLPLFSGGAVGYLGYDMVRFFEPTVEEAEGDDLNLPDLVFMIADSLVIFDHRFRRLQLVANVFLTDHPDHETAYASARARIQDLVAQLTKPLAFVPLSTFRSTADPKPKSNTTKSEFVRRVKTAKDHIHAGDIFQVVPSQRFELPFSGEPIDYYRALRHINPSPYMFCLELEHGFSVVGSSPEVHVRCLGGQIDIRPIAGTRPRGKTEEEDEAFAEDLLADPKERAEHIMLVDLARNDVGRVAEFSSVEVTDFMIIERYSHVMHIVSNVDGQLKPGQSSYDVMRATFPAGTVSGSPKVRAMQIIRELEGGKRGAYSGAVGYFGFDGGLDSCIALRTAVLKDGKVYVQAGAGIVADSDPDSEYEETVNKAKGALRAAEHASWLSEQDAR
ncbi:MAG: anthranilate synthase component I [Verrucomicrobiota bacterium]